MTSSTFGLYFFSEEYATNRDVRLAFSLLNKMLRVRRVAHSRVPIENSQCRRMMNSLPPPPAFDLLISLLVLPPQMVYHQPPHSTSFSGHNNVGFSLFYKERYFVKQQLELLEVMEIYTKGSRGGGAPL